MTTPYLDDDELAEAYRKRLGAKSIWIANIETSNLSVAQKKIINEKLSNISYSDAASCGERIARAAYKRIHGSLPSPSSAVTTMRDESESRMRAEIEAKIRADIEARERAAYEARSREEEEAKIAAEILAKQLAEEESKKRKAAESASRPSSETTHPYLRSVKFSELPTPIRNKIKEAEAYEASAKRMKMPEAKRGLQEADQLRREVERDIKEFFGYRVAVVPDDSTPKVTR